jgi:tRNA A-37 threonylcarbamoyl transferase component Bud32
MQDEIDRLLDRFERAWQGKGPPTIEAFLPPARLTARTARALVRELIKIDLEYRWRRPLPETKAASCLPGQPRLEDYVERLPLLGPLKKLPLDLIGEEYRVRQRWGDRPDHAEYARRFPRHKSALRKALDRIDAELAAEGATVCVLGRAASDSPLSASGRGAGGEGLPRVPSLACRACGGGRGEASLRCPHCRHTIEIGAELMPANLACPACGGAFSVETLSKAAGRDAQPPARRLGRYELGELLGTGAFGSVWQAWDTELARHVAVKVPRGGQLSSPGEEERFLREARSAASLHHPGIVAVCDVGRAEQTLYIVSDLVRGMSLEERLHGERLSFVEAAELLAGVADALDYAHRQGVIHRDVKPSNIMLTVDGGSIKEDALALRRRRPLLMDFGLALRDAGEVTMTVDGQVLGTPAYMSPEQVRNPHAVDGRSDVYSLGVILYELLTGELPFRGNARMLLVQVVSDEPRPPRLLNDRIPRDLETICLKCLQKDPARRYRTAGGLAADLRRWLAGEPIRARSVGSAERLCLWAKRNPALLVTACLAAAALVAVKGAPVAAVLVAIVCASLLFALHKAKLAAELARSVEDAQRQQQKTAATIEFALKQASQAREERQRALTAESQSTRRFAAVREFARSVLFDLASQITEPAARALLVRSALAYLNGLAKESGSDPILLREAALAYARLAEVQEAGSDAEMGDPQGALSSYRKSLDIFASLARAHPDNVQAQRDWQIHRQKVAELEQTLAC